MRTKIGEFQFWIYGWIMYPKKLEALGKGSKILFTVKKNGLVWPYYKEK